MSVFTNMANTLKKRFTIIYNVSFIFLFIMLFAESKKCDNFYENNKYHLSTKTPYSFVSNNVDNPIVFDGCSPTRMWSVIRHGTRNPSGKLTEKMEVNLSALKLILISHHEDGKGSLCPEVVDSLRLWEPSVSQDECKLLTHEGEDEMLLLGERFQNRFPNLLPEIFSNTTYKFRYTASQRTQESAQYFTVGLFGRKEKARVWYPEPLTKDPILRFYKTCVNWQTNVYKNPDTLAELEKFKGTPEFKRVLDNLSRKIGLSNPLKFDDARMIYHTCGFETAWHPKKPSPWCALFSKEDMETIEYAEDLKYFWIDGYGFPLTYQQACVAISDMFQHLMDENLPQNTFYFSHSGTILKLLAHLGLYRDPHPLTGDMVNSFRLWRTSKIDAFGSNLAFVLYKCKGEDKVLTLHQERPVTLPGCPEGELCPLHLLKDLYKDSIQNCHFSDMCSPPPHSDCQQSSVNSSVKT